MNNENGENSTRTIIRGKFKISIYKVILNITSSLNTSKDWNCIIFNVRLPSVVIHSVWGKKRVPVRIIWFRVSQHELNFDHSSEP